MFLTQFSFTITELELDYYLQKVHVRGASQVAERLKTYEIWKLKLTKLGNFDKISEKLGIYGKSSPGNPNSKFRQLR